MTTGPFAPRGAEQDSMIRADLRPVFEAIDQAASRRAERILADADAAADETLEEAQHQAQGLLGAARTDGAAAARRLVSAIVADARRDASEEVRGVERAIYDEVRARAKSRLDALASSPAAAELSARLQGLARARLGDDVVVETLEGEVGIVAHDGRRRLDLSADALLDRVMSSMPGEIAELWA